METKQVIEGLATMGPLGWSVVAALFIFMLWGLKKQYTEGNFPATLVFGIGTLVLTCTLAIGAMVYMAKSQTKDTQARHGTKMDAEKEGVR